MISNRFYTQSGFSLVEMAVVLAIVGLVIGGLMVPLTAQMDLRNYNETKQKIAIINEAVIGFAILNGRLPCPTNQLDSAQPDYGLEDCSLVSEGYLPWRTLGLPPTDAWGQYWRYRAEVNFYTSLVSFSSNVLATASLVVFSNNLRVFDSAGNNLTSDQPGGEKPLVIIYSTGKDLIPNGLNSGAVNNTYESNGLTTDFDDVLIWITRPVIVNRLAMADRLP